MVRPRCHLYDLVAQLSLAALTLDQEVREGAHPPGRLLSTATRPDCLPAWDPKQMGATTVHSREI